MTRPWPWPGDTALTRARRIAQAYRAVLHDIDPTACAQLDHRMRDHGIRWIIPTVATYTDDDYLTADQAANWAGVNLQTVYVWRGRGLHSIETNEGIRFHFAALRTWVHGKRG